MVPGLTYDFSNVHFCLRPNICGKKAGFSLMMVNSFDLFGNNKENLLNLQYLFKNFGTLLPLSSFIFRSFSFNIDVGEMICDLFISIDWYVFINYV